MKAVVFRTKIEEGNTYVETIQCETEEDAKRIAEAKTRGFKECRKIIGADPETVSTSYEW